ncbi:hypothetical protein GC197_09815 [bacterium]|nr:hypothetical protein [bacterium]
MAKKKRDHWDEMHDAIEHALDTMMGRTPKKALIIEGPMRSKKNMLFWLKRWKNDGPVPKLVMAQGTWFEGRANIDDYPSAVKWRKEHRLRGGQCFQNARQFCLAHPKARYFEGFYQIFETPDDHAWVVMEDGRVLDFTHEAVIRKLKKEKKEVRTTPPLYFGVEVPQKSLADLHASTARNKPVLELYHASLNQRRK